MLQINNYSAITQYFQQESKTLALFLSRLKQIKQWNQWLQESLEEENLLTQHCQLVNIVNETSLIAMADNPHWMTRFRFYIPELLPKLRTYPDFASIKAICCKVRPNYIPATTSARREPQQKLSARNAQLLRETANKLSDRDIKLKAILEKIA
ncbi:MAG: Dna[CI] antecedent, DciA, partial [Gammaproteobacteria bacterium]|nr:Dna[CI] antecedent, DciA [Gammaproteobacteria bacterium]